MTVTSNCNKLLKNVIYPTVTMRGAFWLQPTNY